MNKEINQKNIEYFDNFYKNYQDNGVSTDNWLDHFHEHVEKSNMPIIDLGCGLGNNTKYLLDKNKSVMPCDGSAEAIKYVEDKFHVKGYCFDMLEPFPLGNNTADLIVADLSLHYFTKEDTIKILKEIKRVLINNGNLIARVNSIANIDNMKDLDKEVEHHLYMTKDGRYKRLFDSKDIYEIFNVLQVSHVWKGLMNRYGFNKETYMLRAKVRK